jgi:hypothetical protein
LAVTAGCTGNKGHAVAAAPLASLVIPAPPAPVVIPKPQAPPGEIIPGAPTILARSTWANQAPIAPRLEPMGAITRLTLHHEGMDADRLASRSDVIDQLQKIQVEHERRMHAGDIGYHYIIDCAGRIWEGRPLKYQGAHAGNGDANRGNIGIVLMGNFEIQRPTAAQLASMKNLVNYLMVKYRIPVTRVYTHCEIRNKYDIGNTACPGRYLQREVDVMRRQLAVAEK